MEYQTSTEAFKKAAEIRTEISEIFTKQVSNPNMKLAEKMQLSEQKLQLEKQHKAVSAVAEQMLKREQSVLRKSNMGSKISGEYTQQQDLVKTVETLEDEAAINKRADEIVKQRLKARTRTENENMLKNMFADIRKSVGVGR
ncbi:hypothetical protein [Vibrio harveyi]|uniref:hypothetical protein n=1 Tax=Vibrio harveyi TaxID=669 RepID=UPI0018F158B8|nr:hypothetical protein [Vibrio harveyi]